MDAAVVSFQGRRPHMEDTYVLNGFGTVVDGRADAFMGAIFDGHNGGQLSKYAAKRFPELMDPPADASHIGEQMRRAFLTLHHEAESASPGAGAVAISFFTDGKRTTIANAGDAEALLVVNGNHTVLSEPHRLSNPKEYERILKSGGWVSPGQPYVFLPDGRGIMPTRTLGDHDWNKVGVLPDPYVHQLNFSDPFYLVVACDGLWDVMNYKMVANLCNGMTALAVAKALGGAAEATSGDNVTIMVVRNG